MVSNHHGMIYLFFFSSNEAKMSFVPYYLSFSLYLNPQTLATTGVFKVVSTTVVLKFKNQEDD